MRNIDVVPDATALTLPDERRRRQRRIRLVGGAVGQERWQLKALAALPHAVLVVVWTVISFAAKGGCAEASGVVHAAGRGSASW